VTVRTLPRWSTSLPSDRMHAATAAGEAHDERPAFPTEMGERWSAVPDRSHDLNDGEAVIMRGTGEQTGTEQDPASQQRRTKAARETGKCGRQHRIKGRDHERGTARIR